MKVDLLIRVYIEFMMDMLMLSFLNFMNLDIFLIANWLTSISVIMSFFFINATLGILWYICLYARTHRLKSDWYKGYGEFSIESGKHSYQIVFI